ncbi:UNVERIFIED_CONTAM: Retrovirus-related Pol polyprotein from transposon [Sesamum radiatum]|uniref:Retrovirus-related Pol polyprotein from transposon n=1 Tax=Sesamum radiatum TaxID=300843 RepID=A0AAW2K8U1_SESRA
MPSLDPKVAIHHLGIRHGARPTKQSQRVLHPDLIPRIEIEGNKLIDTRFIREVKYSTWISNIVPVKKKNGQICIYVDFRDLNKVMPFELKNVGATYQHAMQNIFDDMVHKKVECYVDDLIIKTKTIGEHLSHLQMVFNRLRKYNLKRNPLKCAFGVMSGKLLSFIVHYHGIEVDPATTKKLEGVVKFTRQSRIHQKIHIKPRWKMPTLQPSHEKRRVFPMG